MLIVTLLVGDTTAVDGFVLGGSGGVVRRGPSWLSLAWISGTEGAGLGVSCCKSDMTWVSSGFESLSLGRLCSCSGSSEPPVESLRLRVEESEIEDDILEETHLEDRRRGGSAEKR